MINKNKRDVAEDDNASGKSQMELNVTPEVGAVHVQLHQLLDSNCVSKAVFDEILTQVRQEIQDSSTRYEQLHKLIAGYRYLQFSLIVAAFARQRAPTHMEEQDDNE